MKVTVNVTVNGESTPLADGTAVDRLVADFARSPDGIAVAVNGEIVPRSAWTVTLLGDADRVEVLGAAQGG